MRKFFFLMLLCASHLEAATLQVGPARTYTNLNAALAAAVSGDVIEMDEDITFTQCSVLPNKGPLGTPIQIKSSNTTQPGVGVRFDPSSYAANVAVLQAANTGCPALGTAVGAQDYIIGPGLKFLNVPSGYRGIIELGANTATQQFEADQPQDIVIDRVWIQGDTWIGQKVGVDMNGKNLTVQNSYLKDIKGVGQDAVGMRCFNGTGPITIHNNFINAAGYGFICGGDRPNMMTFADINAGATTTTATLSSFKTGHTIATLRVGQYVSILTNAGTMRHHPKVVSCGTSTPGASCTSNNITFEAIPVTPDTGTASDIQWGAIPSDISIRRNHFWKDPNWMDDILDAPSISSATPNTSSGSLPAAIYYYRVQATYCCYQTSRVYSIAAAEVQATLSATGRVTVSWGAVTGPSYMTYRIFRSTTTGVYAGYIDVGNVTSYVDTGLALTGTSTPPSGTNWVMKNMMELKFANRVQIDSNIFENSPVGSESGYAIWFKSNEYGGANYMHTRDVMFEKNLMDGMDGCFSILGRIDSSGDKFTRPLENLTIRQNICLDSNTSWMQGKSTVYAIKIQSPVNGLTVEYNTIQHTMRGLMYLDKTTTTGSLPTVDRFNFRNNVARKEQYAVYGESCTQNNITECFTEFVTGSSTFTGNCLGGITGTNPAGNTIVPLTTYEGATHFTNYQHTGGTASDFTLHASSTCQNVATDGGDPGANTQLVVAATSGVLTGAAEGTSTPVITTTSPLADVVEDVSMTQVTFAVTGGTPSYTWSIAPGSTLPAGLSLSSGGVLSGTPTTPGTYTFSVRVTDSTGGGALSDTQQFQLTVTPTSATLNILTSLASAQLTENIRVQLQATGGTTPYTWSLDTGSSLPSWLTLDSSGLLTGTADAIGTSNFTVKVTDAVAATDTQALSQVVTVEVRPCGRLEYTRLGKIVVEASIFRRPTEPVSGEPDCATKGDRWINTSTGVTKEAVSTTPLVWAVPPITGLPEGLVALDNLTPPAPGDFIIGNEDGGWTRVGPESITGLDASALKTGTIDAARIPTNLLGIVVPFHVSESGSLTWTVQNADTEVNGTPSKRQLIDTSRFTQIRMTMWVQGAHPQALAKCFYKWSLTINTFTISDWVAISGGDVPINAQGAWAGAWADIPAAARTENTVWALFCSGGNAQTFAMGTTSAQFR